MSAAPAEPDQDTWSCGNAWLRAWAWPGRDRGAPCPFDLGGTWGGTTTPMSWRATPRGASS